MHIYATPADLVEYAGPGIVDEDTPRKLARASERVDSLLLTAVYDTTPDGMPVDPAVRDALTRATCALVQWWGDTGDETGAGGRFVESQIGTLRLKRAESDTEPDLAPATVHILTTAGLLSHAPLAPDRSGALGTP
ncbi:hypothetical protein GCM10012275_39660 [Longimycelium tulufanense]|uniref:Uncharacterized protein n=1 Tax=Longimycelium tulufanense TaxID=907463 RepID=A0A8J3CGW2_9PSEU|nr:hypothetical protein [Longimycelium tulufanense]GGM65188.1 hypothetical protein GCM10012275_39660 [Longimycelium tulufanense]